MSLKEKITESAGKAKDWVKNHQGDIIYGCYVALCIGAVAAPIIRRSSRSIKEARRDRLIYDPSMGFYWETRRNLTNNQKLIIEQRHRNGESYGKILQDLHLLKR